MTEHKTFPGKTYAVTSAAGCTVTDPSGLTLATVAAGEQKAVVATSDKIYTSAAATVTQVFKGAPALGGGGGSSYTLTAEAVKAVVPIYWDSANIYFGTGANTNSGGVALGAGALALGRGVAVGWAAKTSSTDSIVIGCRAKSEGTCNMMLGLQFGEIVDGTTVSRTSISQGTGSITIGAGANTLNTTASNGTVTESSNAVTIGCKASNSGADSVVIGAQASGQKGSSITIGAGAVNQGCNIVIGKNSTAQANYATGLGASQALGHMAVALGHQTQATVIYATALGAQSFAQAQASICVGFSAQTKATNAIAVGKGAIAADYGVVVHRSTAEDGTVTQLYFSGANTPLAATYEGGAPMLGYTVTDTAGNVTAAGTRSLLDLLTNNSTFAPATTDENGDWVMPTVFHPSDLDLPAEEVTEPTEEEYKPLPVYPIVEPEIDELTD